MARSGIEKKLAINLSFVGHWEGVNCSRKRPQTLPAPLGLGQWMRVLVDFNQSRLDPVGPLGRDQGMAVLKDMNDLEAGHEDFVKSLVPRVDVV
jgi:hypothetical protein